MKKSLLAILLIGMVGCTNDKRATDILIKSGFTDIKMTGYDAFACSEDDMYHSGFKAKNSNGMVVEGTVCCGSLKGCTIRYK